MKGSIVKKVSVISICIISLLCVYFLNACGKNNTNDDLNGDDVLNYENNENDSVNGNDNGDGDDTLLDENESMNSIIDWLPAGVTPLMSESEKHPELDALIIKQYDIPEDALGGTGYYYNYVDINLNITIFNYI